MISILQVGGDPLPEVVWSKVGGRLPAGRADAGVAPASSTGQTSTLNNNNNNNNNGISNGLASGAAVAASAQLVLQRAEPADAGIYVCTAKNAAGTATANATLAVYCE